jgi:hypothetical protein
MPATVKTPPMMAHTPVKKWKKERLLGERGEKEGQSCWNGDAKL